MAIRIRFITRRDMEDVMALELAAFGDPWSEREITDFLKLPHAIGVVVEDDGILVGFMLYEIGPDCIVLHDIAINELYRREGIGRQLVDKLIDKLHEKRRRDLLVLVRERNLEAQLFFRALGFRTAGIVRHAYWDVEEDGYRMRYRKGLGVKRQMELALQED